MNLTDAQILQGLLVAGLSLLGLAVARYLLTGH